MMRERRAWRLPGQGVLCGRCAGERGKNDAQQRVGYRLNAYRTERCHEHSV